MDRPKTKAVNINMLVQISSENLLLRIIRDKKLRFIGKRLLCPRFFVL